MIKTIGHMEVYEVKAYLYPIIVLSGHPSLIRLVHSQDVITSIELSCTVPTSYLVHKSEGIVFAVLRIHGILVWILIRIRGFMPLTNGSVSWIRILPFSSLTFKIPTKN
jgi:hypothetical protein